MIETDPPYLTSAIQQEENLNVRVNKIVIWEITSMICCQAKHMCFFYIWENKLFDPLLSLIMWTELMYYFSMPFRHSVHFSYFLLSNVPISLNHYLFKTKSETKLYDFINYISPYSRLYYMINIICKKLVKFVLQLSCLTQFLIIK